MLPFNNKIISAIETITAITCITGVLYLGTVIGKKCTISVWQQELLSKGYGEYDKKTGVWHLCEPEVVLLNRNVEAIKVLNGGQLTINDYIKVVELDLKTAQKHIEDQTKELVEQDLLIEKYRKNIKIPGESSKNLKKSDERPLKSIDTTNLPDPFSLPKLK